MGEIEKEKRKKKKKKKYRMNDEFPSCRIIEVLRVGRKDVDNEKMSIVDVCRLL